MKAIGNPDGPVYLDPASGRDHVYAIKSSDGFVKIGVTKSPVSRMATLQCGNPYKLTFLHCMPLMAQECDAYKIEAELHRILAAKRAHGEWFKVSEEEVDLAYNLAQYSDNIFKSPSAGAIPS